MAYVNIAEWNHDQVGDWLRGLEDVIHPYIHLFMLEKVDGKKLLHIAASDLIKLHIISIGHQEIILQAVNLLRNLHYHLHQENAQLLALKLSSKARSTYNELCILNPPNASICDSIETESQESDAGQCRKRSGKASTKTLLAVADVLSSVKALVGWLHKSPFNGIQEYDEMKSRFVELAISLATITQRDAFIDKQSTVIMRDSCFQLAQMADKIIQESKDPMILQPAFLDVTTMKKRPDDTWGISLFSSYHGIHQISVLRALSPAHNSGKLMGGDQIIQVNYQTVVGWTPLNVTQLMQENPIEIFLTIKKCPRHASTQSNIYFKPFRLPSKKRTYCPWASNGLLPNRFDLHSIPNLPFIKSFDGKSAVHRVVSTEPHNVSISPPPSSNPTTGSAHSLQVSDNDALMAAQSDVDSDLSDDAFLSDTELAEAPSSLSVRFFSARPRPQALRRATIPGATMRPTINYDQVVRGGIQKQTTLPKSSNAGFDALLQQDCKSIDATNLVDRAVDCTTPSSEEMPFIDELDDKDQPSPGTRTSDERRAFIDKADLSEASPLKRDPPVMHETSSASVSGRSSYDTRAPLDKSVSSPMYCDDYEDRNSNLLTDSTPEGHSAEWDKSVVNSIDDDQEAPLSASSSRDDSMHSHQSGTGIESMTSFGEATYVNQGAVRDYAGDHFNRRLTRGNRRISCRDLGQGDQQGWLYRRKEHKGFLLPHRWVKRWFILNKSILYGYKDSDSLKADSLIYLPGFHVSPAAPEMKARRFAFKIFHSRGGATFYFACESAEERSRWMSQMGLSAMSSTISRSPSHPSDEAYYSETDDELDDKHGAKASSSVRPSSNSSKGSSSGSSTTKTALSYFSSGKSQPLKFLQSSKAALSNPVPTSNFRSYVRVRDSPITAPSATPSSPKLGSSFSKLKMKDGSVTLGKEVRRKNSIRERLMLLPNLTMDRRKATQKQSPDACPSSNPKRICTSSKSDPSLVDKAGGATPPQICHSQSVVPIAADSGYVGMPGRGHFPESLRTTPFESLGREGTDETNGITECPSLSRRTDTSPVQKFSHFETPLDAHGIKLKCASQYYPVTLGKDRKDPMQAAFQMDLSTSPIQSASGSPAPPKKAPRNSKDSQSPKVRPRVPPGTKFLSPSERQMPVGELGSSVSRISRTNQPPNLVIISPTSDDGDSPKAPFKPAMGISMVGKQRRTPTISPKEILPHYPGMEYPPTFEPESYSLTSQRGIYSQEGDSCSQDTPPRATRISPQNLKYPSPDCGYINIGESGEDYKGFHHQIYVTSPFINPDVSAQRTYGRQSVSPQGSLGSQGRPSPHASFRGEESSPGSSYHKHGPSTPQGSYTRQGPSPPGSLRRQVPSPRSSLYGPGPTPHDLSADSTCSQRDAEGALREQEVCPHHAGGPPQGSYHRPDISPDNSFRPQQSAFNKSDSSDQGFYHDHRISPRSSFNRQDVPQQVTLRRNDISHGNQRPDNVSPPVGQSLCRIAKPPTSTGHAATSSQIFAWLRNG